MPKMMAAVDSEAAKFSMLWFSRFWAEPAPVVDSGEAVGEDMAQSGGAGRVSGEVVNGNPCLSRWLPWRKGSEGQPLPCAIAV